MRGLIRSGIFGGIFLVGTGVLGLHYWPIADAEPTSFPPGDAKENWAILRALSAEVGTAFSWDSLAQLRQALIEAVPHLAGIDQVPENDWQAVAPGKLGKGSVPLRNAIADFYLTNPIARASEVMAELSAMAKARAGEKMAAE